MSPLRREFRARCRADRDELFRQCRERLGAPQGFLPADWLDDLLTELLGFDLVEELLPQGRLATCDLDRKVLALSARLVEQVRPRTDLVALQNSTKAHELGHIRLHEAELRAGGLHRVGRDSLPSEEAPPEELAAEERREQEADFYAAVFLVPGPMLFGHAGMKMLLDWHQAGDPVESERLWEGVLALARSFKVSGSLMRRLLVVDLGLLKPGSHDPADRSLAVRRAPLHPW